MKREKKNEQAFGGSVTICRDFVESTADLITQVDSQGRFLFVNHPAHKIFGLKPEKCLGLSAFDFVHPDDRQRTQEAFAGWLPTKKRNFTVKNRQVARNGLVHVMHWQITGHCDEEGQPLYFNNIGRDITDQYPAKQELQVRPERVLQATHDHLEQEIDQRTEELRAAVARLTNEISRHENTEKLLRQKEGELRKKSKELTESNIALKVLLRKGDEHRTDLEEQMRKNIATRLTPYLQRLKKGKLGLIELNLVQLIESTLMDLVSPTSNGLAAKLARLTPTESAVANLIVQRKTSKEIAAVMGISHWTVDTHRENIRKKVGIKNKTQSLKKALLSIL